MLKTHEIRSGESVAEENLKIPLDPSMPRLGVEVSGPIALPEVHVLDGQCDPTVGRSLSHNAAHILVLDPYLAPEHFALTFDGKGWFLVPRDTANGVYVRINGRYKISEGDVFIAGSTRVRAIATPPKGEPDATA